MAHWTWIILLMAGCGRQNLPKLSTPSQVQSTSATDLFRDIAAQSGLNVRWTHNGKTPLSIIETIGHGCAFLDYDQDGLLDIFIIGNRNLWLYRNLGNGHFADVTKQAGLTGEGEFWGVAVGDYDNDGFPDLFISGHGKCLLYHNVKSGTGSDAKRRFEDVTAPSGLSQNSVDDIMTAAAFVDLDGDGKLDLIAARYIQFTPQSMQFCIYQGVRAGCGVKNYDPALPRVFRNHGDGKFTETTHEWGFDKSHGKCLGIALRAMDNGKGVAVYEANDEEPGDLYIPQGKAYANIGTISGTAFNRDGLTQGGMGVDWGDYNNDGSADLVAATFQGEPSSIYRGEGGKTFSEVGALLGITSGTGRFVKWTAKFLDYDNDGWLDLLFTCGHTQDNINKAEPDIQYPQPMLLYHNEQGRVFRDDRTNAGPSFTSPFVGRGAALGDFDNDGRQDLLVVDEEGPVKLLRNQDRSGNHWLGVHLVGVRCNRDGIGARVIVTADGKTYFRDQQLCGGYISAHDPRLHFGLGSATHIERVTIRWPNGRLNTVKDLPIDTYVEITEGKGRTDNSRPRSAQAPVHS